MAVGTNELYMADANTLLVCPNDVNILRQECCRDSTANACTVCAGNPTLYDPRITVLTGWPAVPTSKAPCNTPPTGWVAPTEFVVSPWGADCRWGRTIACVPDEEQMLYSFVRILAASVFVHVIWRLFTDCAPDSGEGYMVYGAFPLTGQEQIDLCSGLAVDVSLTAVVPARYVRAFHTCQGDFPNLNDITAGSVRIQF